MNKNVLIVIMCLLSIWSYAQELDIKGNVIEKESGMPLLGVNVIIEGTSRGTTTDFDGNFTLTSVSEDATLVFSYLGFKTKKVKVADTKDFNIQLESDAQALEDVVVIGYGTSSRRNLTGAVSTIDSKSIDDLEPTNVGSALQGTVAGVNVTPQSGTPGSSVNIRIRGVSTNGNNRPLIILNGFQFEGGLNSINPNVIESFTVLKDAEAAIYGATGSNGVILITTKNGEFNQRAKFEYKTYYGLQETTRKLPLLNATEYSLLLNESYSNAGQVSPIQNFTQLGQGTNWQDEVFDVAPITNHSLSVTGGSEKVTYAASASLFEQEGIVGGAKSKFSRSTARLNLNVELRDNIDLSSNIFYNHTRSNNLNSFGLGSVLFNAINIAPTIDPSVDDLTGEINLGNEVINPLTQIRNTYSETLSNRLSGNVKLSIDYLDNFNLEGRIGFNSTNTRNRDFQPEFIYGPNKVFNLPNNSITLGKFYDSDYTFDLFNTYENTYGDKHHVKFMVGMTVFKQFGEGLVGSSIGVPANSIEFADLGSATGSGDQNTATSYAYDVRRLSYFSRIQYDYDDKYLFSALIRSDSSTRFGPGNRTGYFPSASAGWVASEEDFFPENDFIDFFKIRSSYGVLGNDRIGDFLYLSVLSGEATYVSAVDGSLIQGQALGPLANSEIKWEEAKRFNIGFDSKLFNNQLGITFDYFLNNRKDLLIGNIPVSGIFGISAPGATGPTVNAGSVRNSGIELSLDYSKSVNDNLNFSVNFNVSTLNNRVTEVIGADFLEGGAFGIGQPAPSRMEVGKPIGYFYGYQSDGIFQTQAEVEAHPSQQALGAEATPGDIRYKDLNNDGVIDENDRTDIGNPIPDVTGGLNFSMSYKNFDFILYSFANLGNDIVRNYERNQPNVNKLSYNLERWTGPGTSNTVPKVTTAPTANAVFSDFYVEDGSFLRIQTISLGYTLPNNLLESIGVNSLRVYAKIDNAFTFTEYTGFDPAASSGAPIGSGIDLGFYPSPRTYTLGLNVNL